MKLLAALALLIGTQAAFAMNTAKVGCSNGLETGSGRSSVFEYGDSRSED